MTKLEGKNVNPDDAASALPVQDRFHLDWVLHCLQNQKLLGREGGNQIWFLNKELLLQRKGDNGTRRDEEQGSPF